MAKKTSVLADASEFKNEVYGHITQEPPRMKARVIELHQPCELIGNAKTMNTKTAEMIRLEDGSGDWLIKSKKTGRKFILGAGNMKLAELLD